MIQKIKTFFYHLYRGSFCDLPTFGTHPGLGIIIIFMIAFTAATGWHGLLVSSLIFLPIFLWGSYHRSVDDPEEDTPAVVEVTPAVVEVSADKIVADLLANPYPHDLMAIRREVEREWGDEETAREEMDAYCTHKVMMDARQKWLAAREAARAWLKKDKNA
jgi:hypothetical protein